MSRKSCGPPGRSGWKGRTDDRRRAGGLGPHPPLLARGPADAGLVQAGWPALQRAVFRRNHLRLSATPLQPALPATDSIDVLLEWQEQSPGLPPSGFIFHMSRCGSTLAARMLAASPRNIVLSEADPIDYVLRAPCATPPSPRPTAGPGSGPSSAPLASGAAATRRTYSSSLRVGTSLICRWSMRRFRERPGCSSTATRWTC